MTMERRIAGVFALDDRTWLRHANPWSVWTRNTVLPLLVAACWSRVWLGWWSLVPVALAVAWAWLNPRVFPPPATTDAWASRAVLGERVWMNRRAVPVPPRHRLAPHVLSAVAGVGAVFVVYGVSVLHLWPTLFGAVLVYAGKLWFLDRMVWLYEDMHHTTPEYRSWLY